MSDVMKIYIGDGVYCKYEDGQFILYTSNGIEDSNHIYLEAEHIAALQSFLERVTKYSEHLHD